MVQISTDEELRMPELARSVTHDEGAALIRDWILGLDGDCPAPPAS